MDLSTEEQVPLNDQKIPIRGSFDNETTSHDLSQRLINKEIETAQIRIRPAGVPQRKVPNFRSGVPADLTAMSVASLYINDDSKEMDTDNPDNESTPIDPEPETEGCHCTLNGAPNPFNNNTYLSNSLYFADGKRSIDFVLVWTHNDEEENPSIEDNRSKKRAIFEENLLKEGLELEHETVEGDLHFIKIHAPFEVLRRYSEILKLRMPMRESLCSVKSTESPRARTRTISNAANYISDKIPGLTDVKAQTTSVLAQLQGFWGKQARKILVDEEHFPAKSHRFTAVYSRDKEYLFDLKQSCFFTAAIRSRIVQFILDRKRFSRDTFDDYAFGIGKLITDEVFLAAYPLHDGELHTAGSIRSLLYTEWSAISKWYRYQPLDYIKEYFGVKIGLYFAWLGFYTYMLLLASVVGIICFIYSWTTIDNNKVSQDICSPKTDIKMCPLCDHWCDYWDLKETCFHAKVTYLFDNSTTVFFAIFMSFWATLFLELWKRYSAEITHRWDLTGFDIHEEHPRPEYLARLSHVQRRRVNIVTNTMEPLVPFWRMKLPATIFSFSIVILLVAMAIVAVLGVVLYRMSILVALSVYKGENFTTSSAILFTTATAASINLMLIVLFNWMYTYLAEYLTELELLRTQTEFDDSLTLKIYLLQFVNYYASIFYIAFFKGKFIGYPGDYNRFFQFRQEECGLGGCLMELSIQLAIIMIGKQAMNTILEMLLPKFYKWLNTMKVRMGKKQKGSGKGKDKRWLRDLKLVEWGPRSLFPEYLEMVLQYGFVTIFVSAFPLAPFFALLNNVLEMRLDARKLLTYFRRPIGQRVRDIGVWYRILDSIGKLSVITNGFIIAFTSDFIPRLVYRLTVSEDGSLNGYLNHTLAYFNTSHLQVEPRNSQFNVSICRYPDYRAPPWSTPAYEKTSMYWHILAARLAFVVVFENVVALVMIFVRWVIPDMSQELRDQIRREAYITNEIIIKQETMRARLGTSTAKKEEIEQNVAIIRMEQLMNASMSGSQLDLVIHGDDLGGPSNSRSNPIKYNLNKAFIDVEGKRSDDDLAPVSI